MEEIVKRSGGYTEDSVLLALLDSCANARKNRLDRRQMVRCRCMNGDL